MTKKEVIWREILFQRRQRGIVKFTQKALASQFAISLSTVSNALEVPRACHAIHVTGRFFTLEDYKKLLILLASERTLTKDTYYQGRASIPIGQCEGQMPAQITFGLFSGYKFAYQTTPADYDHLYIYADKTCLPEILNRIPQENKKKNSTLPNNFFVIQPDPWFSQYSQPSLEQLYCDIWNAPEWYAKDFLKELENKLGPLA